MNSIQLSEFKEAAEGITKFPPLVKIARCIAKFPPFNEMENPEISISIKIVELSQTIWDYVGKSLIAFFDDELDPLSSPEVITEISQKLNNIFLDLTQEEIDGKIEALRFRSSNYRILASLIFEAEKFIREVAKELNYPIPDRRSGILERIAFEECLMDIIRWLYDWEALSRNDSNRQLQDWQDYQKGKIDEVTICNRAKHWDEKEEKLFNTLPEYSQVCPLTYLCLMTFEKYKESLPSHASFIALQKPPSGNDVRTKYVKFGIFGGEYKEHFRARKGKGKPKDS
jgi:hypothetical protein